MKRMQDSKVDISIITPVYNTKTEYLDDYLKSILSIHNLDYEVIIVDDGSSDSDTIKWLKQKESEYDFLKIYYRKENKGISVSRNEALDRATGKYIQLLDSDDLLAGENLYQVFKYAEKKKAEIVFCGYYHYGSSTTIAPDRRHPFASAMGLSSGTWFFNRGFLNNYGIRYPEGKYLEDSAFIFKCLTKVKKYCFTDCISYINRVHDNSTSHSRSFRKMEYDKIPFDYFESALIEFGVSQRNRYSNYIYGNANLILSGIACIYSANISGEEKLRISKKTKSLTKELLNNNIINAIDLLIVTPTNIMAKLLAVFYAISVKLGLERFLESACSLILR